MIIRLILLSSVVITASLGWTATGQAQTPLPPSATVLSECAALYSKHEVTILDETQEARTYLPYDYLVRGAATRTLLKQIDPNAEVPVTAPGTAFSVFTDEHKLKKCDDTMGFRPVTVLKDTQTPDGLTCSFMLVLAYHGTERDELKTAIQEHVNGIFKTVARAGVVEAHSQNMFNETQPVLIERYKDVDPVSPHGIENNPDAMGALTERCMGAYPRQVDNEWDIMKTEQAAIVPAGLCQGVDAMISAARTAGRDDHMAEPADISALFRRGDDDNARCNVNGQTQDDTRQNWYTCRHIYTSQQNRGEQRGHLNFMGYTLSKPIYNVSLCPGKSDWTTHKVTDPRPKWSQDGTVYTSPDGRDSVALIAARDADCGKSLCDVEFAYEIWAGDADIISRFLK